MLISDPSFPCNLNVICNMEGSNLVVCIVCYALYGLAWLPKTTRLWGFADDFFFCVNQSIKAKVHYQQNRLMLLNCCWYTYNFRPLYNRLNRLRV